MPKKARKVKTKKDRFNDTEEKWAEIVAQLSHERTILVDFFHDRCLGKCGFCFVHLQKTRVKYVWGAETTYSCSTCPLYPRTCQHSPTPTTTLWKIGVALDRHDRTEGLRLARLVLNAIRRHKSKFAK